MTADVITTEQMMIEQVVVTALDWVMDADTAFLAKVKPVLAALDGKGVAVIGFSSRDRAEIEPVRTALDWSAPFITENGSAIFTSVEHNPFAAPLGEQDGEYFVAELGCPYVQARAGLRVLANEISHPLKGFGDFTVPQLERFLKVSEEVAHRAKAREFSEPFMTPKAVDTQVLVTAAEEMGFGVVLRDPQESRFSDLVGAGVSLTSAIAQVVDAYKPENASVAAVVIGTQSDLQQVGEGDWTGVEVQSQDEWLAQLQQMA